MAEAVRVYARYDIPNEEGVTRRERNERMNHPSPPFSIQPSFRYLWNWYVQIAEQVSRMREGICHPIPPTEFKAWVEITNNIVKPVEFDILFEMDRMFCQEVNLELRSEREKQEDKMKRQAEQARKK